MEIAPSHDLAVRFGAQILQGEKPSPLQSNSSNCRNNANGGLLLGQREVVVVKKTDINGGEQITPVKLVNHGDQQKEATRRLFDAHVYTRSYEKEAQDHRHHFDQLRVKLKTAEKELVLNAANRRALGERIDFVELERKPKKPPMWLQNDQDSRELLNHVVANILKDPHAIDRQLLNEQMWMLMESSVNKWTAGPDEVVAKQAQDSELRARKAMQQALKEASECRSRLKNLERKHIELERAHRDLLRGKGGSAAGVGAGTAAGGSKGSAGGSSSSGGAGGGNGGGEDMRVQDLDGNANGAPDGSQERRSSRVAPVAGMLDGAGAGADRTGAGGAGAGAGRTGKRASATGPVEFTLQGWDGDFMDISIHRDAMEQIDHETFEALTMFDEDMQEMLEEIVNEKVRRILMLDPSKFDGRLPFGIKGSKDDAGYVAQLQQQNAELRTDGKIKDEEIIRLREMISNLRGRLQVLEKGGPTEETPPEAPKEEPKTIVETVVETKTIIQESKWNDENVQQAINEAVEKATAPLKMRIKELEDLLKKAQDELAALMKENAKLKLELEEVKKRGPGERIVEKEVPKIVEVEKVVEKVVEKEKIVEKVVEKIVYKGDEDTVVAYQSSLKMLQKVLKRVQDQVDPGANSKYAEQIEKLLGNDSSDWYSLSQTTTLKSTGGKAPKAMQCYQAMPIFADWCNEVNIAVKEFQKPTIMQPVEQAAPEVQVVEKVVVPQEPGHDACNAEIRKLKAKIKEQQEEISRLLLMIEEMRHRLEQMRKLLETKGGDVSVELEKALKEVGLKELVEVKPGPHLKNVYERLYQDALQRMQRLALILEKKAEANKLYFASVGAAKKLKGASAHAAPPDIERLTEAALVAIHGMWYHYDIMFQRVCEHSVSQSIKDTAVDNYRLALSEIFGDNFSESDFDDLGSLRIPQQNGDTRASWKSPKSSPRPFPERRICNSAGAVSPGGAINFAGAQPPKVRKKGGFDDCKGDFKAYMAKMQETGESHATPSTQLHAMRRPRSGAGSAPRSDSLGALMLSGKRNGLTPSVSLPALPKGLANLKGPPPNWLAASDLTSGRTRVPEGGFGSPDSSMVLQDSWMSGGPSKDPLSAGPSFISAVEAKDPQSAGPSIIVESADS